MVDVQTTVANGKTFHSQCGGKDVTSTCAVKQFS